MSPGGFTGALGLLATGVAACATFVLFPGCYDATWGWLSRHVLGGYGAGFLEWAPWIWSAILIVVLYSATRTALLLIISLGGLLAVLRLFFGRGRD